MRISGFFEHEPEDIIYRQKAVKEVQRQKKDRKRQEQKLINMIREAHRLIPTGKKKDPKWLRNQRQIQRGFDIADKWSKKDDK